MNEQNYKLIQDLDRYLEALCKVFKAEGEIELAAIIANANVKVHEQYSYDNWDGGITGHALYLRIPENIFFKYIKTKNEVQQLIKEKINSLHNVNNEFFEEIFLELDASGTPNWRYESGLLLTPQKTVSPNDQTRIWGEGGFRVFLSHKSEHKVATAAIKTTLTQFGATCFVAHEDITPTREWQVEIENALESMDILVAILTEDFHDSDWTDQEIGYALGKCKPIIPVCIHKNPYGFIGRIQALKCPLTNAGNAIVKQLFDYPGMIDAYIHRIETSNSFDYSNILATQLGNINKLNSNQEKAMVDAYNNNSDVRGGYGFNGKYLSKHGPGLAYYLHKITGKRYTLSPSGVLALDH